MSSPERDDLPPLYHSMSLPQSQVAHLPRYSEDPDQSELRVMHSEPTGTAAVPTETRMRCGVFQMEYLDIDLGEFPAILMHPAYGYNGVLEGVITFRKKCSHVQQITVKLDGRITATASEYAAVAVSGLQNLSLVSRDVTLFSLPDAEDSRSISAGTQYRFSIPFPTYIDGRSTPLPPSYTAIHPGASTEISYFVQVDVTRKGFFRRHEVRKIPVLYLPKTRPAVPTLIELPPLEQDMTSERVKAVQLIPKWPGTCQAQDLTSQGTTLPTIHAFLPVPRVFASGDPIPIALRISCPASPAVTKLYTYDFEVQLVKKRKVYTGPRGQLNLKEHILGTAIVDQRTCPNASRTDCCLILRLEAGTTGKESSWGVEGIIEVQYYIRFIVRPPRDTPHLPMFRHDELVQLTTDPQETYETDVLTGNLNAPAMGLATLRLGPASLYPA